MFFVYLVIFILGLLVGSFLNVVIWRLHKKESFVKGRSYCPQCSRQLKWYHNIPVMSFIVLQGRCAFCKQKISWQYPLVELATGLLFVLSSHVVFNLNYSFYYSIILLFYYLIVVSFLIIIFVYDLKYYLILDQVMLPAMVLIFLGQIVLSLLKNNYQVLLADYGLLVFSGIIIGGFFLLQFIVSSGKWIGGGDIRLGFLMGLILGWPWGVMALFLSYLLGTIVSLPLLVLGTKKMKSQIPFGTFLTMGTLIVLFWGEQIWEWYGGLIL